MMKQRLAIIGSTSVRKVLFLLSALSVKLSLSVGFWWGSEQGGVRHGEVIRAPIYVFRETELI